MEPLRYGFIYGQKIKEEESAQIETSNRYGFGTR